MKYHFRIEREYTIIESFDREYEAASAEEAQAMADAEAAESNMDCPDDCSETGGGEAGSFDARMIGELTQ